MLDKKIITKVKVKINIHNPIIPVMYIGSEVNEVTWVIMEEDTTRKYEEETETEKLQHKRIRTLDFEHSKLLHPKICPRIVKT